MHQETERVLHRSGIEKIGDVASLIVGVSIEIDEVIEKYDLKLCEDDIMDILCDDYDIQQCENCSVWLETDDFSDAGSRLVCKRCYGVSVRAK